MRKSKKVELLLPAGNVDTLRVAVANGADAIYLGLGHFNARRSAENFNEKNIGSVIRFCHVRNVKVYVTFNILVKNHEITSFLRSIGSCQDADAIIIQDPCLIPTIKKNYPSIKIHLSTQATVTNSHAIPDEIDRVILARECSLDQIRNIAKHHDTEIFVHGALCFCYSGQCLFSSFAGGRSGNRGLCAQPCRRKYNNSYIMSTKDLCLIENLPELIETGIVSLKVEGRMRSPLYVGTVARIYRKYIDMYLSGKDFKVDKKDIENLHIAFNRGFTEGFAFEDSITDSLIPTNRGLFLGKVFDNKLRLKSDLKVGDGISIVGKLTKGMPIGKITKEGKAIDSAKKGDVIDAYGSDDDLIFKTSSVDLKVDLGDKFKPQDVAIGPIEPKLPSIPISIPDKTRFFVKVYDEKGAFEAERSGADTIYCPVDCDWKELKKIKRSQVFLSTPRALDDYDIKHFLRKVQKIQPDGVLVADRGLLARLDKSIKTHLDYSFNLFNDIDLECYGSNSIISPELNLKELKEFKNKNFMVFTNGNIVLMTTKEKIKAPELVDEDGRHFRVRKSIHTEILNSYPIGLFDKILELQEAGLRYFYFDLEKNVGKTLKTYLNILNMEHFDRKLAKGFTTGHLFRGVT